MNVLMVNEKLSQWRATTLANLQAKVRNEAAGLYEEVGWMKAMNALSCLPAHTVMTAFDHPAFDQWLQRSKRLCDMGAHRKLPAGQTVAHFAEFVTFACAVAVQLDLSVTLQVRLNAYGRLHLRGLGYVENTAERAGDRVRVTVNSSFRRNNAQAAGALMSARIDGVDVPWTIRLNDRIGAIEVNAGEPLAYQEEREPAQLAAVVAPDVPAIWLATLREVVATAREVGPDLCTDLDKWLRVIVPVTVADRATVTRLNAAAPLRVAFVGMGDRECISRDLVGALEVQASRRRECPPPNAERTEAALQQWWTAARADGAKQESRVWPFEVAASQSGMWMSPSHAALCEAERIRLCRTRGPGPDARDTFDTGRVGHDGREGSWPVGGDESHEIPPFEQRNVMLTRWLRSGGVLLETAVRCHEVRATCSQTRGVCERLRIPQSYLVNDPQTRQHRADLSLDALALLFRRVPVRFEEEEKRIALAETSCVLGRRLVAHVAYIRRYYSQAAALYGNCLIQAPNDVDLWRDFSFAIYHMGIRAARICFFNADLVAAVAPEFNIAASRGVLQNFNTEPLGTSAAPCSDVVQAWIRLLLWLSEAVAAQ